MKVHRLIFGLVTIWELHAASEKLAISCIMIVSAIFRKVWYLFVVFLSLDCPNQKYERIDGKEPLKFPVNLQIYKKEASTFSSVDYNCSLYGYYLDYSGFKVRWKNITDGVFNLTKENNLNNKFNIQVT